MTVNTSTKKRTKKADAPRVLVLRTCDAEMRSHRGFVWPTSGPIEAPDWEPTQECGNGLHGWLWGEGDAGLGNWSPDAKWLVVSVDPATIIDLGGKVKFPRGDVVCCGDRLAATTYLLENGGRGYTVIGATATAGEYGAATAGDRGTATAGYAGTATAGNRGTATAGNRGTATAGEYGAATAGDRGTATAGYAGTATAGYAGTATAGYAGTATAGEYGTATAGEYGTATAGDRGTATAGDNGTATAGDNGTATAGNRGTATAGDNGTATAGECGTIVIKRWDGARYRLSVGYIGENGLLPNTPYRLDDNGNFIAA